MSSLFQTFKLLHKEFESLAEVKSLINDSDLPAYVDFISNPQAIDDRELLLERVLVLMSRANADPKLREKATQLQEVTIDLLYKDLPHPPSSYMRLPTDLATVPPLSTKPVKYAFRTADGSFYNPFVPAMGKAGSPYARSVPAEHPVPPASLPDPGLLFDTLLARGDKFEPHPSGISSLFFAFADLVIHSIFNTRQSDWDINDASSYLDLSILYGSSEAQVDSVRRKDGSGKLWNDVFADNRLLLMPPASCALLVLLSRNHNYIAHKILEINENKTYKVPDEITDKAERISQDDEIFHRARLVNCGFFMQIILRDYVGAILGLARDGSDWRLNPLKQTRSLTHDVSPRGEGNVVSVEFNLLYRWHATLSEPDEQWTEAAFKRIFKDKELSTVTPADFGRAARVALAPPGDVKTWTFAGLSRGPDGNFRDDDLAAIIQHGTATIAGSFGARKIPHALRVIEILSIQQARTWGACTMNEFRKFIGLKPFASFEEWNSNKDVAATAAHLYGDIDNLELYVGLQAEEAKQPRPGAGLCPGYTISRAILADAVCLTRGDRFLTVDFTPFNLTTWGYLYCECDKDDGAWGGVLTKMLFTLLPQHYPTKSAYAHFPFLTPDFMKKTIDSKLVAEYNWEKPAPPKNVVVANSYADVQRILSNPSAFASGAEGRLRAITQKKSTKYADVVAKVLQSDITHWAEYFEKSTLALIEEESSKTGSIRHVDIVRNVINVLPVRWICHELAGLKIDATHPKSYWYIKFSEVCQSVYTNLDPVNDWTLRARSIDILHIFVKTVKGYLSSLASLKIALSQSSDPERHARKFLLKLHDQLKDADHDDLAASLFAEVVPTAAHFSQAIASTVDYYLAEERVSARQHIAELARQRTKEADTRIGLYIREALYANPPVSIIQRTAVQDGSLVNSTSFRVGDRVLASIAAANQDPKRPADAPQLLTTGEHGLLAASFFEAIAPRVLGVILNLKNVHATTSFNKFTTDIHGLKQSVYMDSRGVIEPFPESLLVQFSA